MHLTKEEEKILEGEQGEVKAKAMRILKTLGDIFHAEKLIPITSTQIAGISYKTIGDTGLEFLEDWSHQGVKVVVPSYMNPAGMDLEEWEKMGISKQFAEKQLKIINALSSMGVSKTCTCTPYLAGLTPNFGDHVAWSESSAVVFVNSVLGARTNREGGPSALSAALIGKTPNYGLHLKENRIADLVFEVNMDLSDLYYSLLGYYIGEITRNKIPLIRGIKKANWDQLKSLGAGLAASGGVSMFMIPKITPEAEVIQDPEIIHVEPEDLIGVQAKLTSIDNCSTLAFGCPHCSMEEIKKILEHNNPSKNILIFTTKENKERVKNVPANVKIFSDTCIVVSPIKEMGISCIGTDSAKCAHYSMNLSRIKTVL
ncbi:MAG: aconitase X catalytic domain-containing protein, partial [Promethearchaeota archaeon]